MKVSRHLLAQAGLLATASAAAHQRRQFDAVTGVLSNVQASLQSFTTTINDFPVSQDVNLFNAASDDLLRVLSDGTITIQELGELSELSDASGLQGPVDGLTLDAQTLTQSLVDNKAAIEAAGICITIRISLDNVNTGSRGLLDAITGKVPEGIRAEAAPIGDGFVGALSDVTIEFGEGNCVDSPSPPGGGAPGGRPPSSSSRPGGPPSSSSRPGGGPGGPGGGPTLSPTSVPGGGPTLSGPPGGGPTLSFPGGGAPGGGSSRPGGGPSSGGPAGPPGGGSSRPGGPGPTGGPGSSSGGPRPTSTAGGPGGSVPGGRPTSASGTRGVTPTGSGRPPAVTAGAAHGPNAGAAGIFAVIFGALFL